MPYSTINKSTDHFNAKLFTGNGSTNAITGIGHKPDLTWLKSRSGANDHQLYDIVRGVTKYLRAESSDSQGTAATGLTAFNTDGYTLGSAGTTNVNGGSMASWNWKAGGSQGSSNTDGTINTLYTSANTVSGFSISTYTGVGDVGSRTFGHGLTKAPEIVMIKNLSANENWVIGSDYTNPSLPWKYKLTLDNNAARAESGAYFADTAPTNSLVTIEGNAGVNGSGNTLVAYCFHSVEGYSKMGQYKGNNNNDGPFIYTGFKPKFILIRQTNDTGQWRMYDTLRESYGQGDLLKYLASEVSSAEATTSDGGLDILSNGFKIRSSGGNHDLNGNQDPYLYMAFGQTLVGSNNVPATAR